MNVSIKKMTSSQFKTYLKDKHEKVDLNELSDEELVIALKDSNFNLDGIEFEPLTIERVKLFLKNSEALKILAEETTQETSTNLANKLSDNLNFNKLNVKDLSKIINGFFLIDNELLEKYKIEKTYETLNDRYGFPYAYRVLYHIDKSVGLNFKEITLSLNNEFRRINGIYASDFTKDYFEKNNIEFKEEKEKIIPVGLIECYNENLSKNTFSIIFQDIKDIYKAKDIVLNFERALALRCEALEFINKFNINIFE